MALRLEQKQQVVAEVHEVAREALSLVVADYRGVAVQEMTELRSKARQDGIYLRVVRNTLARRALKETEFECIENELVGPTILAFSGEDPGAPARLFKDFAKDHEDFEVKALAVGGETYPADQIDRLAKLPTREQALAMLMSVMRAPVEKLARTLNEVPGKLVRTTAAVRDQKQEAEA